MKIFQSDVEAIRLFSNIMVAMDINRVDYFMGTILNKIEKNSIAFFAGRANGKIM